jgi:endonuclease/exonuclease/phosphatase family metal-dependent hydrolase
MPIGSLACCPLPSAKDRKLLVAEFQTGCGTLHVGTVHLESSPENTTRRLQQLDRVLPGLCGAEHAVLMGDFNFDPRQRSEQSRIERCYEDLWTGLRGDEPGYTVDSRRNAMRLLHKQLQKRVRFDRILLRSEGDRWRALRIELLGTEPIAANRPEVYASDHFGVGAVLTCGSALEEPPGRRRAPTLSREA